MTNQITPEKLRAEHRSISEKLNIDPTTEEHSWALFTDTRNNYNLDDEPLHWLCCSLWITCRQTVTPTVGSSSSTLQGNCVSLTRLLRLCNINLHEFFKKICKWADMTSLPEKDQKAISRLQHCFAVSMSIYGKYCDVFFKLFVSPTPNVQKRGKKSKPTPCDSSRLHEFCWLLFVCAKADYPEHSEDLVNSYNMLLCCIDLLYANAIMDNRKDITNPEFVGLPPGFLTDGAIPTETVCVIKLLCEDDKSSDDNSSDDNSSDVLQTKDTIWKAAITKLFDSSVLKGDSDTHMDIISTANFDDNLKSLKTYYDSYILSCGEFDETIALSQKSTENSFTSRFKPEQAVVGTTVLEQIPLCRQTPLSGRNRIESYEYARFTPISTANTSVNKLRKKLAVGDFKGELKELLKSCTPDPMVYIKSRIVTERERFLNYTRALNWNEKMATYKFDMAEALYYKLLENIILVEMPRRTPSSIRDLCCEDLFNKTLLVCSVEIIIYAHNLQQNFPWILDVFGIPAFVFYRIIEPVIGNHQDLLSRDIIKHLTFVEEQCMESLCWLTGSPLWSQMENVSYTVPTSQEAESLVDMMGITPHKAGDSATKLNGQSKVESTPTPSTSTEGTRKRKHMTPDSAKKRLFKMDDDERNDGTSESGQPTDGPVTKKEQSKDQNGPRLFPNQPSTSALGFNSPLKIPVSNGSLSKRRPGVRSLGLFFRKFYTIAAERMKDLCSHMGLVEEENQKQIWTIFEHSITHCTKELMRDRHLDQMLMCAIYVYVKIKRIPSSFAEIMRLYRSQPQSDSHVYRSVFIKLHTAKEAETNEKQSTDSTSGANETNSQRVQPTELAGVSVQHGAEVRGDIILFYNTVYVPLMQDFAFQFGSNERNHSLILSPLPRKAPSRSLLPSPKLVDDRIPLYVTPMEKKIDLRQSPNAAPTFVIGVSPSKDLKELNRIVSNGNSTSCRLRLNNFESSVGSTQLQLPRPSNRFDRLISDRQQQEINVSGTE